MQHAHVALLDGDLVLDDVDLLLGGDGLGFDFLDELGREESVDGWDEEGGYERGTFCRASLEMDILAVGEGARLRLQRGV